MTDPLWIRSLLGLHIAAGAIAFIFAPLALATRKGGKGHRRRGKIYFYAMTVVAASAMILSAYRPILFLVLIAVLSFYAAFYAYRVLGMKNRIRGERVGALDWATALFTVLCSVTLACLGFFRPALVQNMGIVPVFFGILGTSLGARRIAGFLSQPTDPMFWWYEHLQGMIISYMAAWTAFSVVTISRLGGPTWLIWLWPTMIGVPAILLTKAYYRRKLATRRAVVAAD